MMSTEGREAIIWIQNRGAVERGQSQAWLRKHVGQVRRDLGLPTRNEERRVAIRTSVKKFSEAMDRLGKSINVMQGKPGMNPYSARARDIGQRLKP